MWELAIKYPLVAAPTFLTLIPIATFFYCMAYKQRAMRFLFVYLIFKLIIELVMLYMASQRIENLFLSNILIIIGYFLIARMFYESYDGSMYKAAVTTMSIIFTAVACMDIYRDGMTLTFRYSGLMQCILIMIFVLMYFYEMIQHPRIPQMLSYPFFWVCAAMIIYFATCVFIAPLGFYIDRFPTNSSMQIFTLIPYILESAELLILGFGIFAGE